MPGGNMNGKPVIENSLVGFQGNLGAVIVLRKVRKAGPLEIRAGGIMEQLGRLVVGDMPFRATNSLFQ